MDVKRINERLYEVARRFTNKHNLLWQMKPADIVDYESLVKAANEVFARNSLPNPQAQYYSSRMRILLNAHRS